MLIETDADFVAYLVMTLAGPVGVMIFLGVLWKLGIIK